MRFLYAVLLAMATWVQTVAPAWDANPSITVGAGSSRALYACATWSGTGSVSGVSSSVDGAFTLVTASLNTIATGGRTQGVVWYVLLNPTTGTHTITSTNTGSVDTKHVAVTECTDVHQTTPYDTPVIADTVAASYNHVITGTAVGDLAISGCNTQADTGNPEDITSGTKRWDVWETAFWGTTSLGGTKAGEAGSTTLSYSGLRSEGSALSGFAIKSVPTVTAALTGTATASITEADIVAGGKTIILTLTGDTWIP